MTFRSKTKTTTRTTSQKIDSPEDSLGNFSNHDGDGNENAEKSNGFVKPNNNFARASRLFVHFFASLHDYNVKMPDFTLYGGRKQATTNFSFSF